MTSHAIAGSVVTTLSAIAFMLSVEECRNYINNQQLSDTQIEVIRDALYDLANSVLDEVAGEKASCFSTCSRNDVVVDNGSKKPQIEFNYKMAKNNDELSLNTKKVALNKGRLSFKTQS